MSSNDILAKLVKDLSTAIPGRPISVLTRDPLTGSFEAPVGRARLDLPGLVIERVLAGDEWVPWEHDRGSPSDRVGSSSLLTMVFPICVNTSTEHVVVIHGGNVSKQDIRLIRGYCRQATLALDTRAIVEILNRKIERLASMICMVDELSAVQSYHDLLQTVLDRTAELLLAEQGSIMLIEKETDALLVEASRGALHEPAQKIRIPRGVGIAGGVVERGEPMLVENIELDPRIGKKNRAHYRTSSFVSVPLKIENHVVGVMNFADKATGVFFDDVDLRLAQTCASHAAIVLDRKELCENTAKLKRQAITDHLSGLLNRGGILGRLREELSRSHRFSKTMSLVMLDIDGFKKINDIHGHATGDRVLRRVSEIILGAVRSIDISGRYGGDEFLVLLPETDMFFATHMAERVRSDIAQTDLSQELPDRIVKNITVSIGIATYPSHGTSPEVLIDHADEALYRAKANGRNRVSVY